MQAYLTKFYIYAYNGTMAKDTTSVYTPTEEDLSLLTDELRDEVERGVITMLAPDKWYDPNKPVLRKNGKVTAGTGRIKGAKNIAVASKETAFKRRKPYTQALEDYFPVDEADSPNAIASFRDLLDAFWKATQGSPQKIHCPECGYDGIYAFKIDPHAVMKMVERLAGRAKETQEVNIRSEHMLAVLNSPVESIQVIAIDPEEERRRRKMLADPDGSGVIEGEFSEDA